MGYETRIDLYRVRVRPDAIRDVADGIAAVVGGYDEPHWMVGLLKLEADGSVLWDDDSIGNWKSYEEFIEWLALHCESGFVAFWSCEGDGAAWAYELDGARGYTECSARRVSALKAAATRRKRAAKPR